MENRDALEEQLAAFDRDRSYKTIELVKENARERTELVQDEHGRKLVRKYIELESDEPHPYERLSTVNCEYLQPVLETMRIADRLVVVCDYIEGIDLREFVTRFGPVSYETARGYVQDIGTALSVLHSLAPQPVIHRDVNPSNIIISKGKAVLVDLGISRMWKAGASSDTHLWGTAGYAAPEQFGFRQTDARTDVYSLGMCLRFMLTGAEPSEQAEHIPDEVLIPIYRATLIDPFDRYTNVKEFLSALDECKTSGDVRQEAKSYAHEVESAYTVHAAQQDFAADACGSNGSQNVSPGNSATGPAFGSGAYRLPYETYGPSPGAQPNPASGRPRDVRGLDAHLVGLTDRSPVLKLLWHIWQVVGMGFAGLFVIAVALSCSKSVYPADVVINLLLGIGCFAFPFTLTTNAANINDRVPWLKKNRHLKIVLIWALMWVVLFVVVCFMIQMHVPTSFGKS